jgi:hypothetical protein
MYFQTFDSKEYKAKKNFKTTRSWNFSTGSYHYW